MDIICLIFDRLENGIHDLSQLAIRDKYKKVAFVYQENRSDVLELDETGRYNEIEELHRELKFKEFQLFSNEIQEITKKNFDLLVVKFSGLCFIGEGTPRERYNDFKVLFNLLIEHNITIDPIGNLQYIKKNAIFYDSSSLTMLCLLKKAIKTKNIHWLDYFPTKKFQQKSNYEILSYIESNDKLDKNFFYRTKRQ